MRRQAPPLFEVSETCQNPGAAQPSPGLSWPRNDIRPEISHSAEITQKITHPEQRILERMCYSGRTACSGLLLANYPPSDVMRVYFLPDIVQ